MCRLQGGCRVQALGFVFQVYGPRFKLSGNALSECGDPCRDSIGTNIRVFGASLHF